MLPEEELARVREHIARAVADRLVEETSIDWTAVRQLDKPILRIQACLQDGSKQQANQSIPGPIITHLIDISGIVAPSRATPEAPEMLHGGSTSSIIQQQRHKGKQQPPATTPSAAIVPDEGRITPPESEAVSSGDGTPACTDQDAETSAGRQRRPLGGLRPARRDQSSVDLEPEPTSQRQISSGDKFPKRRKQQPTGHVLQPSTLDKLIRGIWEQIHGSLSLDPQNLLDQVQLRPLESAPFDEVNSKLGLVLHPGGQGSIVQDSIYDSSRSFKRSNVFCSQVTQASRACRSLEVIVQARWVEHFDAYVDSLAANDLSTPRSRFNKAALMEACTDFGWSEKELRNKMSIWRGYNEIKQAGGWAALVFAGMGIYRFCKYRIGFDKDSMQRLRNLRPAIEVAADTLHPNWRQLLTAIGESSKQMYRGHPHDYVISLDGSPPVPLRVTYLQWDPDFSYQHIDEPVIDEHAWGCDDPRWTPMSTNEPLAMPTCDTCGKEQSDDPKQNSCFCFPTLFGTARPLPVPVLIFRTADGRNNGLMALCAFERGAPVGEFVGVVTKGLSDVDVMESAVAASAAKYQIWQGRQGNFTRFVNHSCKANAQYQRFTWLGTQRIILVSKGIEAGSEISVDYSDKYWKGLDKKCLCGESCCRYRRDGTDARVG
ncbi:set domain-containing protein [Diaporthe amygdali]|uniref:set domain-containing protein n=1 Tax=Phomopsis amygdali TaxID=1214568 RepID=UPI0022FE75D5|nr:set domain-containing protein [Diaporthe amygdali]KAJ0114777.1 set domain-containing protein [Diaporthe amygdali]